MSSFADLRAQLQGPRRAVDTWYGKHVMRRISIYLTWVFSRMGLSPNTATTLSLVSAIAGAVALANAQWGAGVLLVNLWYLLDHVDGELARFYKRPSASGLFYDTSINFLAQPLTFLGLGWGLSGGGILFLFGVAGAFGYLMMSLIPMCEASILLEKIQARGSFPHAAEPTTPSGRGSVVRRTFSAIHRVITFPNFLMVFSAVYLLTGLFPDSRETTFARLLIFYALCGGFVWTAQLFHKVVTKKLDKHPWIAEAGR